MPDGSQEMTNMKGCTSIRESKHLKMQTLRVEAMAISRVRKRFRRHKTHRAAGLERVLPYGQRDADKGNTRDRHRLCPQQRSFV